MKYKPNFEVANFCTVSVNKTLVFDGCDLFVICYVCYEETFCLTAVVVATRDLEKKCLDFY